eukprot:352098_1
MKGRFTAADVRAEVRDLKPIVEGSIVLNVYDVDSKTFLLKLRGTTTGASNKVILLIESGCRFHTTKYVREKSPVPSQFAAKLRKHIRNKRLEGIRQIGGDRVIDFVFGNAEGAYHVILELYSSVAVRHVYPTNHATVSETDPGLDNAEAFLSWLGTSSIEAAKSKWGKKKKRLQLKQLLLRKDGGVSQLGTSIIEHCILQAGLNPNLLIVTDIDGKVKDISTDNAIALIGTFHKGKQLMDTISCISEPGFIICSDNEKEEKRGGEEGSSRVYIEFVPHLLMQHNPNNAMSFPSFDTAVDEFFSRAEDQKIQMSVQTTKAAAEKRVQAVREANEQRINDLNERQERLLLEATALEASIENAELALSVLRSAVDNGINWQQLKEHIKAEKMVGNPVAAIVAEDLLKLSDGIAVLELPSPYGDDPNVMVPVKFKLSAHANARSTYNDRRWAAQKVERTLAASEKAIRAAERYSQREMQNATLKHSLAMEKKPLWFEKFLWFVSSENYLVLSGRDTRQSQILISQYLRPCDVFVHSDIEDAHFCIVRNKDVNSSVSPVAILETGCMAVCRSHAWSSRARTSAWWVNGNEVVQVPSDVENLPIGISVCGKKKFLPPHQLEMGLGLLFRVDDVGAERHIDERSDRGLPASDFFVVNDNVSSIGNNNKGEEVREEVMNGGGKYDDDNNNLNNDEIGKNDDCLVYTFPTFFESGGHGHRKQKQRGIESRSSAITTNKCHHPPLVPPPPMETETTLVVPRTSGKAPRGRNNKMKLIKKKYRDQDDDDRELAFELLGKNQSKATKSKGKKKINSGSQKIGALQKEAAKQEALNEVVNKMNADAVVQRQHLSDEVGSCLEMLETKGLLPTGGFDAHALQCLGEFESEKALSILKDYSTADLDTIRNKSGLLLGIIRRYKKNKNDKIQQPKAGTPLGCGTITDSEQNNILLMTRHIILGNLIQQVVKRRILIQLMSGIS